MAINIDELLRLKYGQDRFNPGAGQNQMTFQEWMDRHPALQGRQGQMNKMAYNTAVSGNNLPTQTGGPAQVDAPDMYDSVAGAQTFGAGQPPAPAAPMSPSLDSLGAPDMPGKTKLGPATVTRNGKTTQTSSGSKYRDFLNQSWGKGSKSTATKAAAFRRQNGKKKPTTPSTSGNTQQAH